LTVGPDEHGRGVGGGGPRLALLVVRIASRFVPHRRRDAWRREWLAEIHGRWAELGKDGRRGAGARLDLLRRSFGSFPDAVSYDRGRLTMEGISMDLKVALRNLVRRPIISLVMVLTLAVGIGANGAIFGLAREVLLRPFPYPDPGQVVAVEGYEEGRVGFAGNVSYPNMADLEENASTLDGIASLRWWEPVLSGEGGSVVITGATVTANFFRVLGVEPGLGRFFRPEEEGSGRAPRVVLSHGLWAERFGGDRSVVGRRVRLNDISYEIIGVTSEDFEDPWLLGAPGNQPRLWRTVDGPPSEWPRSGRSWRAVARVRSGVALEAARDEVSALMAGLVNVYPEHNAERKIRLVPLRERIVGPTRPALWTLLGSVGLLLLVACGNLANLLLGRALERQREFAVQRAIGAPRWRIVRRGMVEAVVLAVVGGALGVAVAFLLGSGLETVGAVFLPRRVEGLVDGWALFFTLGITVGVALLFGFGPALHASRVEAAAPGRDEGRGHTRGPREQRFQRGLVLGEVAVTVILLVGAGLLLRSFQRLGKVDLGVTTEAVVTIELHGSAWWDLESEEAGKQWEEVLDAVRAVPEVAAAGAMDYVPLSGSFSCDGVSRADRPAPSPGEGQCAETRSVLPGALEALEIPLLRGRLITRDDGLASTPVVVVDESMAEAFWPGEDPIGKSLSVHTRVHEVVGIVANIRHFGPTGVTRPTVYIPTLQEGWSGSTRGLALVIRGQGDPGKLVPVVRQAVLDVRPTIAFGSVRALDDLLGRQLAGPRFRTFLLAAFGLAAVVLAVLGIGGVMAYSVARRVREMGVRMAVGAQPEAVRALILREGIVLTAIGLVIGLIPALFLGGVADALLFEVSARDPLVFAAVTLLVAVLGGAASYIPARRASRVDPVRALSFD
jgi:putative ABC transport system permease protein